MRFFLFACFVMVPVFSHAQEPTIPDDIEQRVRDIAALVVQNTDSIAELRARVDSCCNDNGNTEIFGRLADLENRVFGLSNPVVRTVAPVIVSSVITGQYTPPTRTVPTYTAQPRVRTVYPRQVTREGGRTVAPVRGFFRNRIFGRVLNTRTVSGRSHLGFPGNDIIAHLTGPPHYVSLGYVLGLSHEQRLSLHDSLHGF